MQNSTQAISQLNYNINQSNLKIQRLEAELLAERDITKAKVT